MSFKKVLLGKLNFRKDIDNITLDQIKKRYNRLALVKHPDKLQGSTEQFQELRESIEAIKKIYFTPLKFPTESK